MRDDPLNKCRVKRGSQLPQSKLHESDVRLIRQAVAERDRLKAQLSQLSNASLAKKFDVHVRTIDRITTGENWSFTI
jgi:hypothetical protein